MQGTCAGMLPQYATALESLRVTLLLPSARRHCSVYWLAHSLGCVLRVFCLYADIREHTNFQDTSR